MKPAPGPAIGVKGCVNAQDGESLCCRFKAYGVVEGTCGVCVVGLLCWLSVYSHRNFHIIDGVNIGVNRMVSDDKP